MINSEGLSKGLFEIHKDRNSLKTNKDLIEGKINIINELYPSMKRKRWGRIIIITSQDLQ